MNVFGTHNGRLSAATPFLMAAALAVVGAGIVAAAVAHAPSQPLVWMIAYLVLVVGVAQAALGGAQAWLSLSPPSRTFCATQFILFNAGNVGVIGGTLGSSWPVVLAGTLLFTVALAMFLYSSWRARSGWLSQLHRLLVLVLFGGATIGLVLSAARHLH